MEKTQTARSENTANFRTKPPSFSQTASSGPRLIPKHTVLLSTRFDRRTSYESSLDAGPEDWITSQTKKSCKEELSLHAKERTESPMNGKSTAAFYFFLKTLRLISGQNSLSRFPAVAYATARPLRLMVSLKPRSSEG